MMDDEEEELYLTPEEEEEIEREIAELEIEYELYRRCVAELTG